MNQPSAGATLVIKRGKTYVDRARAYKIILDGTEVGRIKQEEEIAYPIAPGRHELRLKMDWVSSPPEILDAAPGQTIVYSCRPNPHATNVFLYITVKRSQYLALERLQ